MTQPSNPALRQRQTMATERRDTNFRILIAEFARRELTGPDVEELFGFSPSGARKYLRDLCEAGVAQIDRIGGEGKRVWPIFKATADQVAVEKFLALLGMPQQPKAPKEKTAPLREVSPGRFLHVMGDDEPYRVRPSSKLVSRDPLVAAIFGAGAARGAA